MITNLNKKSRKDDIKLLSLVIVVFLFVVWLCTPPGNKLAQIAFYGNKTQFFVAKLTKPRSELNEWIFHRNNAVYLARMERKKSSLQEMNNAIKTFPSYGNDVDLEHLYLERAQLELFFGEYDSALNDYLRVSASNIQDKFRIALLYKEKGLYKDALSYCTQIVNIDSSAYMGYACLADVYAGVGRFSTSVRIYDLLIDRVQNRARYFADRAVYKKKAGDIEGYNADMKKAKELSPNVKEESELIEDTLKPKVLTLTII